MKQDAETEYSREIQSKQTDLAATSRWFARLSMHESVANHFSLAVSPGADRFQQVKASLDKE
jgi:hypothetical protein